MRILILANLHTARLLKGPENLLTTNCHTNSARFCHRAAGNFTDNERMAL